jgi:hypothetical protein
MKLLMTSAIIAAGLVVTATCNAQAPSGSTGECKDGSYTSAESKRGACAGHGSVKDWYSTKAPSKTTAEPHATAPAKVPPTPAAAPPSSPAAKNAVTPMAAAAGGGPGQVWVNTKSKVYHCSGDKYYGKTKAGEYMTEAAAKAAGNHADHGKTCS